MYTDPYSMRIAFATCHALVEKDKEFAARVKELYAEYEFVLADGAEIVGATRDAFDKLKTAIEL